MVVKDDAQPCCAICGEPFSEEWDDRLQEWVYVDAARLPARIAQLPDVGLLAGAIVKIGVLDPEIRRALLKELDGEAAGVADARKRRSDRPQLSDDDSDVKRVKAGADSEDEACPAVKQEA